MAEKEDVPSYKLLYPDGTTKQMGEISEQEAKTRAQVAEAETEGIKLFRRTMALGGVEISFKRIEK